MKYSLYKIKDNKFNQWTDWCEKLSKEHRIEALKTLKNENLLFEGFLTFSIKSDFYTLGYSLEKGDELNNVDKNNKLNQKHFEMKKECLDFITKGKSDYFLST